jgi:hypothetical protein
LRVGVQGLQPLVQHVDVPGQLERPQEGVESGELRLLNVRLAARLNGFLLAASRRDGQAPLAPVPEQLLGRQRELPVALGHLGELERADADLHGVIAHSVIRLEVHRGPPGGLGPADRGLRGLLVGGRHDGGL